MFTVEIDTQVPIFRVQLAGNILVAEFDTISDKVLSWLRTGAGSRESVLIIDLTRAASLPHYMQQLRTVQGYADCTDLKWILVVTNDKLHHLLMTIALNIARPHVEFFGTEDQAYSFVKRSLRA